MKSSGKPARPARREGAVLERAVEAVADATPIDWDALIARSPEIEPRLRGLRALQRIAAAHRAATEGPHPAPTLFVWGHLHVLEKLGEGSFGETYRAFDPVLQREVALKLERRGSPPTHSGRGKPRAAMSRDRFESTPSSAIEEARRLARIRHPNVLAVHGAEVRGGRAGIWTDLLRGRTLEEKLARDGPIPPREAAIIGLDLCRALRAVHGAGVIHGDLKASNVIQEEEGRIVLFDFGSGSSLNDGSLPLQRTGTPLILAPEVLLGERPGREDDLYSLGVLLYRLTSGRYPVEAVSLDDLIARHRDSPLSLRRASPDLPSAFARVVDSALAPRHRRFGDAAEMERALADALLALTPSRARETGSEVDPDLGRVGLLPRPLTRFVGRRRELRRAAGLAARRRLLTLTGAGGVGKTRLSIEAARTLEERFPDGIWFVEVAPLSDPADVARAIARAMGIREDPSVSAVTTLIRHLKRRRALLVLDNCEHLRGACADLAAELLRATEHVHILATSREDLGVTGETLLHLEAMPVPAEDDPPPKQIARIESVALFVERARGMSADFVLDSATAGSVARICRQLDGIPLALELAAARVRALSVEEIARRIEERFFLLDSRGGGVPIRHRTLEALIDWSYELLPAAERRLFRRVSVFAEGWTLEAAEGIASLSADEEGSGTDGDAVGILANLVGKSLVERDGRARYRMLEPIRQRARDLCAGAGEWHETARRHRAWFLELAERAASHLTGPEQSIWLARLSADHDNLRAAIRAFAGGDSGHENPDLDGGMRLVAALERFWIERGHWGEARAFSDRLLGHPAVESVKASARSAVLTLRGDIAQRQADVARARACHEEALALSSGVNDKPGIGVALGKLGNLALGCGEYETARACFEESLAIRRETGDRWGEASTILNLGRVEYTRGKLGQATSAFEESLRITREMGHEWGVSAALTALANTKGAVGDFAGAQALLEESLVILRRLDARASIPTCLYNLAIQVTRAGDPRAGMARFEEAAAAFRGLQNPRGEAMALDALAQIAMEEGERDRACEVFLRCLQTAEDCDDFRFLALVLVNLGSLASRGGDWERALKLLAAADGLLERLGTVLDAVQQEQLDREISRARAAVGEEAASGILEEWRARPLPKTLAFARATPEPPGPRSRRDPEAPVNRGGPSAHLGWPG